MNENSDTPEVERSTSAWSALVAADPAKSLDQEALASVRESVRPPLRKSFVNWYAPAGIAASVAILLTVGIGLQHSAKYSQPTVHKISLANLNTGATLQDSNQNGFKSAAGSSAGAGPTLGGTASNKYASSGSAVAGIYGGNSSAYLEPDSRLSDNPGSQKAYAVEASKIDLQTTLEKLKNAFSVKGSISGTTKEDYFWVQDGNVNVGISGTFSMNSWNYTNGDFYPRNCNQESVYQKSPSCSYPTGSVPTSSQVLEKAQQTFAKLGLATDKAAWSVNAIDTLSWTTDTGAMNVVDGPVYWFAVEANPVVDGLETGSKWMMTIGPNLEISSANGTFVDFKPLPSYETVGIRSAVLRSQSTIWASYRPQTLSPDNYYGWAKGAAFASTLNGLDSPRQTSGINVQANPSPSTDSEGRIVLDRAVVSTTITAGYPALISEWLSNGKQVLFPAYKLVGSNPDDAWLQISIADKYFK